MSSRSQIWKNVVIVGVLTAVYFGAGKLGLMLASVHASASPVWPATGIALAAILLLGYRVSPGIFLGAFLVNVTTAGSVVTSIGIATGKTLEGVFFLEGYFLPVYLRLYVIPLARKRGDSNSLEALQGRKIWQPKAAPTSMVFLTHHTPR